MLWERDLMSWERDKYFFSHVPSVLPYHFSMQFSDIVNRFIEKT